MIIGCFALVEPFKPIDQQFQLIKNMGIDYADLTDNHNGGMLGVEYGFTASVSLDIHPEKIRRMTENAGITLTSVCAHANLLDPPAPDVYGTNEIIKAIRLAALLGIKQVITTEGDPKTEYGHNLTFQEKIFTICQKLYTPVQWAAELGVQLLLEPHGCVTDSAKGMEIILQKLDAPDTVGICLDTGNSWLGGSDPMEFIRKFGKLIHHVHFKDLGSEWEDKRGTLFGCGMSGIPLGDGIIGIEKIVKALLDIGFEGPTTLEIAGADNVRISAERLKKWSAR
ncbi:MAG: sugar phosphate isomerase/epimerase [Candidatus Brocadiia bacterium]|nr:MAG: sugar phosphate isomerase/epimerase [Candidatus Brocadiia bacterium]